MNNEGTQRYTYRYPFSKLPSHPGCHIILSRVPCSASVLLTCGFILSWGDWGVHSGMLMWSDLYLLDPSASPWSVTTKNVSRHCHMLSEGRMTPGENLCVDPQTCLASPSLKEPSPFTISLLWGQGVFCLLHSKVSLKKSWFSLNPLLFLHFYPWSKKTMD